ncbi:TonB-dependent receptor plug domain-containing protein [Nibribacter ruber]|uniref:TonB-dependent receptor plug domain-containing protein n=1 Tax=Nibribacter ruber TaxID=2698458 RepID=A0A6P1NUP4_9BACT|nr:carboxypeptidase-like regulatory domain-containing protein [Nibribacter ruber]QHL87576.1 TonB-dependent receptor plug domain-containing protein [Nibribacter ruber]
MLLFLGTFTALSQRNLGNSRTSSYYTYVYQLTNQEAREVFTNGIYRVEPSYFHTVIDSFQTDWSYSRPLPVGHYLFTHAAGADLEFELKTQAGFQVKLLDNQRDLAVLVHDSLGNVIPTAQVKINKRTVPFDQATHTYRLANYKKGGLLTVQAESFTFYQPVTNGKRSAALWKKILFQRPIYYLWSPFRDIVQTARFGSPQGIVRSLFSLFNKDLRRNSKQQFKEYLVLNKPMYRPGDTVRYKAFITTYKGKPYKKPLAVSLYDYGKTKALGTVQPYRDGAYEGSFILHDSLKLTLDRQINLHLSAVGKKKKIISRANFKYEDYELKENNYSLRLQQEEHYAGQTNAVLLKGTDANGLTLPDARVELVVLTTAVKQSQLPSQFIPDTLWQHKQALNQNGETTIPLPPTIFPKAGITYKVQAAFLNASNERSTKGATGEYFYQQGHFRLTLKQDSLLAEYLEGEKSLTKQAILEIEGKDEETFKTQLLQLPALVPLHPYARAYLLKSVTPSPALSKHSDYLDLEDEQDQVQFYIDRKLDSLHLVLNNPRGLPFWYFIYRKNALVSRGQGTQQEWTKTLPLHGEEPFYVSLQYAWAGQIQQKELGAPFPKQELTVALQAPPVVYPGQQTSITLEVKDAKGKPASNVDLTAYALTSKFKNTSPPTVPFYGFYKGRKSLSEFKLTPLDDQTLEHSTLLSWQAWHQKLGLDSLIYYQALYPAQGQFTHYSSTKDSLTQLAPFVVDSGRLVPVHVVYLDQVPVYFSGNGVDAPYSFATTAGYHTLKLRTARHIITLDSVYLRERQKLTLVIDQRKNQNLLKEASKGKFTDLERNNLSQYLFEVEKTPHRGLVYLQQGNQVQRLPMHDSRGYMPYYANQRYGSVLVGPFRPDTMRFKELGHFSTVFTPEPNFLYRFEPGLLKMRERQILHPSYGLSLGYETLSNQILIQEALTEKKLKAVWEKQEEAFWQDRIYSFNPRYSSPPGKGKLVWRFDSTFIRKANPELVFLYKAGAPVDSIQIFAGTTTTLNAVAPGTYTLTLAYPDRQQLSTQLSIQANGALHLTFTSAQVKPAIAQSKALEKVVQQRILKEQQRQTEATQPAPPTVPVTTALTDGSSSYSFQVRGTVVDKESGDPLPGVTVLVKGTTVGAATDINGEYTIYAPSLGTLVFSYIGYVQQQIGIKGESRINAALAGDTRQLQEVVVTAYGESREKRTLSASVATVNNQLQGQVAGVRVTGGIQEIRGISSMYGNKAANALIIVDGLPFSGELKDIDPQSIASMTTLQGTDATSLYGAAGQNGIILITTKNGLKTANNMQNTAHSDQSSEEADEASIRSYFSDYAFWQPRLATDRQGKVTFPVTFPDNVTSWNAYVLAMDSKKRSGSTSTQIKSFKAMMATLSGPRFLIEGDRSQLVGKAVNYLPDTATVQVRFSLNGKDLMQKEVKLGRLHTDSLWIEAPAIAPDSVESLFMVRQANGYADGERRQIVVYKKGVVERTAQFLSLPTDTTLTLTFDARKGPVRLYAQSNLVQVMQDEINYLHRNEYWCNEQAASKLKGLLWKKRIQEGQGQPFAHDRMVRRLIKHLEKTQQPDGAWSWWTKGPTHVWISQHATQALIMAQQETYATNFKKEPLIEQLTYLVESKNGQDKVRALETLYLLKAKVDFAAYIPKLEKQTGITLEEQLRLTRLRQQLNMPAPLDTLQKYRQTTMLGGVYWGKENSSLFDNHISNTLLAYDILKATGNHSKDLRSIQAYLLNERRTGHWRNTYESARVLETLLPDLVKDKTPLQQNQVQLAGPLQGTFTRFPVDTTFTPGQPLTLRKQGSLPLYLSVSQDQWVAQPARVDKDFVVRTSFANSKTATATLEAGKPVELQVEVEVKGDASYVMIEVPIPAGCSYDAKTTWGRNESHREYFRNKVAIFSDHLKKGKYTFTIQLLPRYKGTYTVNPAKAELMYFPTFFGREGVKTVEVK